MGRGTSRLHLVNRCVGWVYRGPPDEKVGGWGDESDSCCSTVPPGCSTASPGCSTAPPGCSTVPRGLSTPCCCCCGGSGRGRLPEGLHPRAPGVVLCGMVPRERERCSTAPSVVKVAVALLVAAAVAVTVAAPAAVAAAVAVAKTETEHELRMKEGAMPTWVSRQDDGWGWEGGAR